MKTEAEIKEELKRANIKLAEIETEMRETAHKHENLVEYERRWNYMHGFIEGLWWVLGSVNSSGEESHLSLVAEIKKDRIEIEVKDGAISFEVWYRKTEHAKEVFPSNRHELEVGYTKVALVKAANIEQVYEVMQHQNWTPKGEALHLIERIKLDHVSMQGGDLVRDAKKDCWYVWTEQGFREFKLS